LFLQDARLQPDRRAHAGDADTWPHRPGDRAGGVAAAWHPGGGAREHRVRSRGADGRPARPGDAVVLAGSAAHDPARPAARLAADLGHRLVAALRDAGHRAGLFRHPGADPSDPRRHDPGDRLGLHPDGARQGPVARLHPAPARAAPRRPSRGGDRRRPARLHAGRLDRDRAGVRPARRGLPRLGEHRQERLPGGAGRRAGAGGDLCRAHHAGRPDERGARSPAARPMSVSTVTSGPRRGWRSASTWIGAVIVGIAAICAIFAPLLVPYDPFAQDLGKRLLVPFWMAGSDPNHILGTDQLGRDYLSRLIWGCRISMLIGVTVSIVSGLIGITLGVLGGFLGGRVDDAVLFAITTRLSIPVVLVALAVVGLLGSSMILLVLTLGLLLWDRFAVVARSTTMQVRHLDFVAAAWCAGCSRFRILAGEVLPNIASHLVVVATLEIALAILLEAALSFLGLGVPPPL